MARNKITLTWIVNNYARKAALKKRRVGLFKKTKELSLLLDVKSCVVVYSPGEVEPPFFPSYGVVRGMFEELQSMSLVERSQKMLTGEGYLTQRVTSEIKRKDRAKKKNDMKEAQEDVNKIYEGYLDLGELDVYRLKKISLLVVDKLKEIEERERRLRQQATAPPPSLEEREGGQLQQATAPPQAKEELLPADAAFFPLGQLQHATAPPPPPPPPLEERQGGPRQQVTPPPPPHLLPLPHEIVGVEDLASSVLPTWIHELMNDNWFMDTNMALCQHDIPHGPSSVINDLEIVSPEHHVASNINAVENEEELLKDLSD